MSLYGYGQIVNKPIYCGVYRNASQTLSNGATEIVDFNALISEHPDGYFNFSDPEVYATIPYAGCWTISASVRVTTSALGIVETGILVDDGSGYQKYSENSIELSAAASINIGCALTKYLESGNLIQVYVYQNTGVGALLNGTNRYSNCHICATNLTR